MKNFPKQEDAIQTSLQTSMLQRSKLNTRMTLIGNGVEVLDAIRRDINIMNSQIGSTAQLAMSVSAKVRRLDLGRNQAFGCQQRVDDFMDLQLCSQGLIKAINDEDFEKVSTHIGRFLAMDHEDLQRTADGVQGFVTSVTEAISILDNATNKVRLLVSQKFDEAVKKDDLSSVERFFKLFPKLDMPKEGIEKFCKYISTKLSSKMQKELASVLTIGKGENLPTIAFADALTSLLENFARVLEVNQPIIERFYGAEYILDFVSLMQDECDSEIKNLLMNFMIRRKIAFRLQQIHDYERFCGVGNGKGNLNFGNNSRRLANSAEKLYPHDVDPLIDEISIMHSRVELYFRFLHRKVTTDSETRLNKMQDINVCTNHLNTIIIKSALNRQMQELLSIYLSCERYFMEVSIDKAINLEECEAGQQCSSMVDDIFFILRKSIRRSISTLSVNGLCAVINNAVFRLDVRFISAIKSSLNNGYSSGYIDLSHKFITENSLQQVTFHPSESEKGRNKFLTQLNNADISTDYIETLWQVLEKDINNVFPKMSAVERQLVDSCIAELKSVRDAFKSCANFGLQQLRSSAIKPRLELWIDRFHFYKHCLSEEEFIAYGAGETFCQFLVMQLSGFLNLFKNLLTSRNYDALVTILAMDTTSLLEQAIHKTTFNKLGSLILDREVRALSTFFTEATTWSVRDKITRLIQIVTILNLDKAEDLQDYWNMRYEKFSWHLMPHEIKQVLSLRSDFCMEDINRVKL